MTHALRILHVIPGVAPRYGGTSTAIWPMIAALSERGGIDVEIATTDADGPTGRVTKGELPGGGANVLLFHRDKWKSLNYSHDLSQWLGTHAGDYDLIQIHTHWNHSVAAACGAARRAAVPYILTPHGMLSDYAWHRSKWKKRIYWWLQERNNVWHAAAFHVTSNDERQEVLRLGVSVPVEVIPLGIGNDAWETAVEPNWLREQCPRAGDRPILLFLSRLHPKKGITDVLLPALAQLKTDAFLAIAGGEDAHAPGFAHEIENEIARLGLQGQVALLGSVAPQRRWAAFDGADLFVLPSHAENFGIVVPEAMARGRPVVVTAGVQFGEHVTASGAGTVVRLDVAELAASLDIWLSDSSERARAAEFGRRYIQDHFTWHKTAERLANLYHRICRRAEC